jgi:hypothetical protein
MSRLPNERIDQISNKPISITSEPGTAAGAAKKTCSLVLGADREISHRHAVLHEDEIDHLGTRVANTQKDQLRAPVRRHHVGELVAHGGELFVARPDERIDPIHELRLRLDHQRAPS